MIFKFYNKIEKNIFELVLFIAIVFIVMLFLFNFFKRKNGTYNRFTKGYSNYFVPPSFRDVHSNLRNPHFNYSTKSGNETRENRGGNNRGESRGELACRRASLKIFGKEFIKVRPNFLNNPVTGGVANLELDCYNNDLKLAVEYSGKQHYSFTPFFHKNKEAFLNQKYRDELKRMKCKENGIMLIEVDYTIPVEKIESHLRQRLRKLGYNV